MIKQFWVFTLVCLTLFWSGLNSGPAQALPFKTLPVIHLAQATPEVKDLVTQLEEEILPQLAAILTPEQRAQFQTAIAEKGTTFRKAFKALTLSPDQKAQLKAVLKSMPKKDAFVSLTPEQKKRLFIQNKALFIPTPAEITEKITSGMETGMKKLKEKSASMPSPQEITDKINNALQAKQQVIPSPAEIGDKIITAIEELKSKVEE